MGKWIEKLFPNEDATDATDKSPSPAPVLVVTATVSVPLCLERGWHYAHLDDLEERAAIMEYDGELTRIEAERRAGIAEESR